MVDRRSGAIMADVRACAVVLILSGAACGWQEEPRLAQAPRTRPPGERTSMESGVTDTAIDRYAKAREEMLAQDLQGRDIRDPRVLAAMGRVPREEFVPENLRDAAYADRPLPIGHGQTISQPYIVALMTQLARPAPNCRALDIGTGSGYQAAILGELASEVYSIEIVEALADTARERLKRLGYRNITVRHGDGYRGWPEHAPFDVIIVAAAPDRIPPALTEQLAPGGRLVIPVGQWYQELLLVEKKDDGTLREVSVAPVAFVPMTGEVQKK